MFVEVRFSMGSKDGALGHFLTSPLSEFHEWYIEQHRLNVEHIESWGMLVGGELQTVTDGISLISRIAENGAAALLPNTAEEARLIDRITCDFYSWCELHRPELLVSMTSAVFDEQHYEHTNQEVSAHFGSVAMRLWDYVLGGRAIGRHDQPHPYIPNFMSYPNSFWTYDEVDYLYHCLLPQEYQFIQQYPNNFMFAFDSVFTALRAAFNKERGLIIRVV